MGFAALLDPQNREVGTKLLVATLLMFTTPFLAYFGSFYYLFADKKQPDSWAAGVAIIVTNLIVAGYCYAAFTEEGDESEEDVKNDRMQPRVGIFKQRTD